MKVFNYSTKVPFNKKIGILYGGMSCEREVSLRSGKNCFDALKRLGYNKLELINVNRDISKELSEKLIEIAFISLHGKYGEDGCIQGLLELMGIPYTGSGVKASAIGMDKELTKIILKAKNLPVLDSIVIKNLSEINTFRNKLRYPLMVKPTCEGSSIGMSKVNTEAELEEAIIKALSFEAKALLEEFIEGKSITVGVLDVDSETLATPILELKTKNEWYDYEAKYTPGMTEFILPAEIPQYLTQEIQELSIQVHKAIGAVGMSRVDLVVSKDNNPYILEINTIPGMTDLSDLPTQAKAMGISYDTLVGIILDSSLLPKI